MNCVSGMLELPAKVIFFPPLPFFFWMGKCDLSPQEWKVFKTISGFLVSGWDHCFRERRRVKGESERGQRGWPLRGELFSVCRSDSAGRLRSEGTLALAKVRIPPRRIYLYCFALQNQEQNIPIVCVEVVLHRGLLETSADDEGLYE